MQVTKIYNFLYILLAILPIAKKLTQLYHTFVKKSAVFCKISQ